MEAESLCGAKKEGKVRTQLHNKLTGLNYHVGPLFTHMGVNQSDRWLTQIVIEELKGGEASTQTMRVFKKNS